MSNAFAEPMTIRVVDGEIVILGPDSVAISLTPSAAEESARRLMEAAAEARGGGGEHPPSVDDG